MDKRWSGKYTIETAMVLVILLGIIFLLFSIGLFWYDRCVIEGKAAVYSVTGKEQELPGILFFDERTSLELEQETVKYSLTVSILSEFFWELQGEKEDLYEANMETLRKWKYIKEKRNEN